MLELRNISLAFGTNRVLDDITCTFAPGSMTGLIGPSGSGKSVLLKVLGRVLQPDHGTIKYDEDSTLSLMFQEGALFDSLSVYDNIAFPLVDGDVPSSNLTREERDRVHPLVERILARVGLSRAASKLPGQLSGGMRRRVSLARALVLRPSVLLLDDPTCGLDPVASAVIMNLIVELHREYRPTTILVSHDLRRLLPVVDSVCALFDGRVVFHGGLGELSARSSDTVKSFVRCRYDLAAA